MLHLPKIKRLLKNKSNSQQEANAVITYLNGLGYKKNPSQYQTQNEHGHKCHILFFEGSPIGHLCLAVGSSIQPDVFFMEQSSSVSPSDAFFEHKGKKYIRSTEMRANPSCMCVRKNPTKTMSSWSDFKKWKKSAKSGDVLVGVSVIVYAGDDKFYAINKDDKAVPEIYNEAEAYIVLGERDIANILELKGDKMSLKSHKTAMEKGFPNLTKQVKEVCKKMLMDTQPQSALSRRAKSLAEYKKQVKEDKKEVKDSKPPKPADVTESKTVILTKWLDNNIESVIKKAKKEIKLSEIKSKLKADIEKLKLKIADPSWYQSLKRLAEAKLIKRTQKGHVYIHHSFKKQQADKVEDEKPPKKEKKFKLKIDNRYVKIPPDNKIIRYFSSVAELREFAKNYKLVDAKLGAIKKSDKEQSDGSVTYYTTVIEQRVPPVDDKEKVVKLMLGKRTLKKESTVAKLKAWAKENGYTVATKSHATDSDGNKLYKATYQGHDIPPVKNKAKASDIEEALKYVLKQYNDKATCIGLTDLSQHAKEIIEKKDLKVTLADIKKKFNTLLKQGKIIKCLADGYALKLKEYDGLYMQPATEEVIEEVEETIEDVTPEEVEEEVEVIEEKQEEEGTGGGSSGGGKSEIEELMALLKAGKDSLVDALKDD